MRKFSKTPSWAVAAGVMALLAGSAYFVNHKRTQVESRNPPRGRFVEVDGVRLHYTEHGDPQAPALLMLHGLGAMSTEMELSGVVERAQSQFRVLVFDRPGYGHSDRPAGRIYTPQLQARLFLQAMEQLGVDRPIVLAHSWATSIAESMAAQAPLALKGLVLISGYYTPSARLDVLFNSLPAVPLLGTLMSHTVSPLLARALWSSVMWRIFSPAPRALRRSFVQRYPKWMNLRPHTLRASAAESAMMIPESLVLRPRQNNLHLPVVLVAGEQDRLVMSWWHSGRLQQRLPNSRLHLVPNAGHMVHHSAPDEVFKAIREVSSLVTSQAPLQLTSPPMGVPDDMPLSTIS